MANSYRIVSDGDHVVCAVSGERIALDDLRYWSVAKQQAYATAAIATATLAPSGTA